MCSGSERELEGIQGRNIRKERDFLMLVLKIRLCQIGTATPLATV